MGKHDWCHAPSPTGLLHCGPAIAETLQADGALQHTGRQATEELGQPQWVGAQVIRRAGAPDDPRLRACQDSMAPPVGGKQQQQQQKSRGVAEHFPEGQDAHWGGRGGEGTV